VEPDEVLEESLGGAEAMLGSIDPAVLGRALRAATLSAARRPVPVAANLARFAATLARGGLATGLRAVGLDARGPMAPAGNDKRFRDRAWTENAAFYGLLQAYLATAQLIRDTVEVADLDERTDAKARFAANLAADLIAPTNFLLTNPVALRKLFDTGGHSLVRGAKNFVHDVRTNGGYPSQVDTTPFELGVNLAATPGKVVFRNDLIELIQYEPVTSLAYRIPVIFCPPWINKYYILDLAPEKSLVEFAVRHGLTVFAISYRNPDTSMRATGFDDYLLKGPRAALDVVRAITGSDTVNLLAACLGGTLNTSLLAYLHARGEEDLVNSSTYLNCLNDHSIGGTLGMVFSDPETVAGLQRKMAKSGYLEAAEMARTFNLLRANDLVFSYVASNWLMGETPPPFDLLAWNVDSTRMPEKMHSFYLRKFWIDNALAHDELELAGERLIISSITTDTYVCAAVDDHIVPWQGSYKTTQMFKGDCRFVLSSSGHIAGIVNPPSAKTKLWTNADLPADPEVWRAGATEHQETWWNDWLGWIQERSGEFVDLPPVGCEEHPVLDDAPGRYVRG
jgi:polyhydroxyalkanoate synthase